MKYKGYTGTIEPDEESEVLFGRVIGLRDVVTFHGDTIPELKQAFQDSVDDYLAFCAARNESPEKPYSGQFVLRINPVLHRELANYAQTCSISLNTLVESLIIGCFCTHSLGEVGAGEVASSDSENMKFKKWTEINLKKIEEQQQVMGLMRQQQAAAEREATHKQMIDEYREAALKRLQEKRDPDPPKPLPRKRRIISKEDQEKFGL
jgi:predicted HicB family RNase H-like nuclease